ncbi:MULTISPECIES: Fic family protein [unclassified Xanthobacter]|uniref:Fic family protein n=1 Tax=unclassified Xanthobacter TaxID=2623496 RepID=UPI001F3D9266|nr:MULTISPECIES: hypothetical protein [unclassified Xanthobacter]
MVIKMSRQKSADLFEALGFSWDREAIPNIPTFSTDRVLFRFRRMLPEFVWDAAVLEGNPFTFPEVKTVLDGITVGGRKLSDQDQIVNLAESAKRLVDMVRTGAFRLNKATFVELHALVARDEALEWGHFRGEGQEHHFTPAVALGEAGRFLPRPTVPGAPELNAAFASGVEALQAEVANPFERGLAFSLFGAREQFFFDGNKRTSRLMMNGVLMTAGMDALSIPAARAQEFNEKMVRFYVGRNADEMMTFLVSCHPSQERVLTTEMERDVGETVEDAPPPRPWGGPSPS